MYKFIQEYDMKFFMSDDESNMYLTTVDSLLDDAIVLLRKVTG